MLNQALNGYANLGIGQAYGITNGTITIPNFNQSMYNGNRLLIVCNGQVTELPEAATLDLAQSQAESLAHKHQSEAYILKPVRKVAPKRDVVTTDL